MEFRNTQTRLYQNNLQPFENFDREHELTRKRLDALLAINAQTAREKALYSSESERIEAESMRHPLSFEQAFAYLGLLIGALSPAAFFARMILSVKGFRKEDAWVLGVFTIVITVSAIVGYFSGKLIGKTAREAEKLSWTKMILVLPFVGIAWGILSGGAGGFVILIFGAFFGALIGALVGAVALPVFTIFHRLLKRGERIERKHFLPLAFGTSLTIAAFILSL